MLYPYMTLADETEILHTGIKEVDGEQHIEVHFERPKYGGFDTARCSLPEYKWVIRDGFTDDEMKFFNEFLIHHAHLLFKYAQSGGINCA